MRQEGPVEYEKQFIRKQTFRKMDRLTLHEKNGVVWISFPLLDQFDFVVNAFSTRIGGVSEGYASAMNLSLSREMSGGLGNMGLRTDIPECDIWGNAPDGAAMKRFLENHRRFAEAVGYDLSDLVFSDQAHTDRVREVTKKDRGNGILRPNSFHDVDGLMTDQTDVAMMTFYADCVPLLLVDPVHRAAACVHSGWRGTIAGIGTKAVQKMQRRYGSDPAVIVAAIGPSICGDCYEVSGDVAARFSEKYQMEEGDGQNRADGAVGRIVSPGRDGHAMLNLQEACRANFLRAGLLPEHISVPDICTAENAVVLFSHRALAGKRGNLAAVLEITDG
jgi:YfiH family protein